MTNLTPNEQGHVVGALAYAIQKKEEEERAYGYQLPSAQLAAWREIYLKIHQG